MANPEVIIEPGRHDITVISVFDAPRDLVFRAYHDPELIPRWWSPGPYATTVEEMDVRRGGTWRFVSRKGDEEYAFKGVYHDVVAPERVVATFEFEPEPGHVLLGTFTFEEHDGKTRVVESDVYPTVEMRDNWINQGAVQGVQERKDNLDRAIAELRARPR